MKTLLNGVKLVPGNYHAYLHAEPATDHLEMQVIEEYVKPGMFCIDVGANIGMYTCAMALAGGQVMAIEPEAHECYFLRKNIKANGMQERVEIVPGAIDICSHKEALLYRPPPAEDGHGSSFASMVPIPGHTRARIVPVHTVDMLAPDYSGRCGFLKVDVNGYELFALLGARCVLLTHRPIIMVKMQDELCQHFFLTALHTRTFLEASGYEVRRLSGDLDLSPNYPVHMNVVAFPR